MTKLCWAFNMREMGKRYLHIVTDDGKALCGEFFDAHEWAQPANIGTTSRPPLCVFCVAAYAAEQAEKNEIGDPELVRVFDLCANCPYPSMKEDVGPMERPLGPGYKCEHPQAGFRIHASAAAMFEVCPLKKAPVLLYTKEVSA